MHATATVLTDALGAAGVEAFALRDLPLVSIAVDDDYENYDYDVLPPTVWRRVHDALERAGWSRRGAREIWSPDGALCARFPRPVGTLGANPAGEVIRSLDVPGSAFLVTPTQAMITVLIAEPQLDGARGDELCRLVDEQPANLDKVADWTSASNARSAFVAWRPRWKEAQAQGIVRRQRQGRRRR